MDPLLIERFFRDLFTSGLLAPEVTIMWHSGEPLTLPPQYYDEAIRLILEIKDSIAPRDLSLRFGIQTNGVLIDEEWCRFFKRHAERLDIGVSCDGPSDLHDLFRVNWNGKSTHSQALRGMDLLHSYGLKYKVIAVVTGATLRQPEEFYDFFFKRREQLSGFHFNILADGNSPDLHLAYSVEHREMYGSFYRKMLQLNNASRRKGNAFEILNFAQTAARILNTRNPEARSSVEEASAPLRSVNLDTLGNVTTFYAGLSIGVLREEYGDGKGLSLGNIFDMPFKEMIQSEKLRTIMRDFAASTKSCRHSCAYFSVCPGGFELLKRQSHGTFEASETAECVIHVKTLVDVLLADIEAHSESQVN